MPETLYMKEMDIEKFGIIVLPEESLDDKPFFDLKKERRRLRLSREIVRSFRGVPVYYSANGFPASQSHSARENTRRRILIAHANEQRLAKMDGGK